MKNGGKNRLNYGKLNIGLHGSLYIGIDRLKFRIKQVALNGKVNAYIEKGERGSVLDMNVGKVVKVSKFVCSVSGISMNGMDDYKVTLKLNDKNDNFTLDVNIPKLLYNTNERNANNLEHLAQVNQIIEKILREQGVIVDMSTAELSSLEINVNSTDKKLYDAMKIIKKGFNNTNDKVFIVENKSDIESLMVKNNYMKIKVYNKVQQLKDTGQLYENENLIRLEVSTVDKSAINTITGYNPTMEGLVENWDKLEQWFRKRIIDNVKKPCDEFNEMVEKTMVEELKQGHKTYDILTLQAERGNLVDLEIFSRAMKRYYKEVGKKSPTTMIKNTKARYEKLNKNRYEGMTGNIEALDKFWKQIGL